ncbi:MAG TPA: hypothetical protein VGL81_06855 [Polyangiaceae bacterium]
MRLGAIAGLGFPRPFAVEALAKVDRWTFGLEYGFLPTTTIDAVHASMWSLAADARLSPFRGAFFIGVLAGRQHLAGGTSVSLGSFGSASEELTFDSWFVNPRLGFLWTPRAGVAFGIDAGVQIPLVTVLSSTWPLSLEPAVARRVDALGRTALPTVDLLRLGFLF